MALKVHCADSCKNSPKKQLLKELTIAFAKNDIPFCLNEMKDTIVWDIVGDRLIEGVEQFEIALKQRMDREVFELQIDNIITHGNTGCVNGTFVVKGGKTIAFCDVYNFSGFGKNAKIKKMTSYIINL